MLYSSLGTAERLVRPIHQVKSGETLSKIAPKYGIGWKTLATHNNIQSPYTIQLGQELKLPEGATIPEGTATSTASEQGNNKTTTVYEQIDSGMLVREVYLVVETANLRGKKVDIEIFDQEKLLAEDDEMAIKVIRDDQETDWINAVKIDDTGKAIVKVKLRKKSDEDYKKQQEAIL
ncbi:MAG: LysM peptidoglycan-binding domain-containing protein [Bacteroidota bacterium]